MSGNIVLYGGKLSLYSARVRSYLRHQRIAFTERGSGDERAIEVVFKEVGRRIIPVVELPDGRLLQDGAIIIDHFEASDQRRFSVYPDEPALAVLARFFDLFGNSGLLRPAMHYRWSPAGHYPFIRHTFRETMSLSKGPEEQKADFDRLSGYLRKITDSLGVTTENAPAIESAYLDFLVCLNAHLALMPYVLGGRPTIADYALFGPLFAHMGRDPVPLALMQKHAPFVFDWTERMNAFEDIEDAVSRSWGTHMINPSDPPETLVSLLKHISEEYSAEYAAHHEFCLQWLANQENTELPAVKALGIAQFDLRGVQMPVPVKAYRHFLSQRMTDAYDSAPKDAQNTVRELFKKAGLSACLDLRLPRRVGRRNHLEVWLPSED